MSGTRAVDIVKRMVAFMRDPFSWAVAAALAVGLILSFQAKLPVDAGQFAEPGNEGKRVEYRLPIGSYGGPVLIELEHGAAAAGARLIIRAGNMEAAEGFLPAGRVGTKRFLLYRGALTGGGVITIESAGPADMELGQVITKATVRFPKAGYWLFPTDIVWAALVVLVVLLGTAAAVIWPVRSLQRACFAAFAGLAVLTIHFLGMGFAARLAWTTPAALVLLIIAMVFRMVVPERS